ncbi:hypothetical protein [Raoultibacter phocaeensis]|uniref:hypothetical protein n=1 Tax=Raoultibacter phocaeensis TaxID=2479841 RepID=UPI0011190732|nr:hypothetical protein [Raoultibacter phocaeensis]
MNDTRMTNRILRTALSVSLAGVVALGTFGTVSLQNAQAEEGGAGAGSDASAAASADAASGSADNATSSSDATAGGSASSGEAGDEGSKSAASSVNTTPKDEVVYARLAGDGAVNSVYVVNVLSPEKPGAVTDYGDYASVTNLTDTSAIEQDGDALTVDVTGESFRYQGDLADTNLPWNVSVTYTLDGKPMSASDLGGASGALEITIDTKRNDAVDPTFFDNYLLQVTLAFAEGKATNVATPDGQIALAGSNTQVTFTGMPGKDGSFTATADVTDFEMDGASLAAVPFSMVIESPDKEGLLSGFVQLADGVGELKDGADQIASGAQDLSAGAGEMASGISGIADGAAGVSSGAGDIAAGANGIASGLEAYQQGLNAQAQQSQSSIIDTSAQSQAYQAAMQTYVGAFAMAYHAADPETVGPEVAMAQAQQATAAQAAEVQTALQALVTVEAANAAYGAVAQTLSSAAAGLDAESDGQSLIGGIKALAAGASSLAAGAEELSGGASSAAAGANSLSSGAGELAGGAGQLADGTGSLYTEIQAMPDTVSEEIDTMIAEYSKSDFEPTSFTSSKNTDVTLVQFVMATEPIVAPEQSEPESQPAEDTFWDRLLALFGIGD